MRNGERTPQGHPCARLVCNLRPLSRPLVITYDSCKHGLSLPLLGHGLFVADSPEVGLELQRWLLPIQPTLRLPVGHLAAHGHLIAHKYTAQPAGIRMVRGEGLAYRPVMIYAHP